MGELLTNKASFFWEDTLVDRGKWIEELSIAIDDATSYNDRIFRTHDLYELECSWGNFFEFLWSSFFDQEEFIMRFPWISQTQFQTLINIVNHIQPTTPGFASNLSEFQDEYYGNNCAWIGLTGCTIERLVFNHDSWICFHREYVTLFSPSRRREEFEYFSRFYIPILKEDANNINTQIRRHQTHRIFKRLDIPHIVENGVFLHGEQIQMHFNDRDESALNIDGTWKHGGFKIPREAHEILEEWGFLLPPEYYEN